MAAPSLSSLCVPATFGSPSLFGIQTVSVLATVARFNGTLPTWTFSQPSLQVDETFCNVTVTYTHPGQGDLIGVEAWLPSPDKWNDVLMSVGGAGFSTGRNDAVYNSFMAPVIGQGYALVTTDAGTGVGLDTELGAWAFLSPGNSDQIKLHNAAARSLEEQGLLAKQLVKAMYGRAQKHAYFNGCSQGGRHALMVSQRYPDLYDGIFANGPALSLDLISAIYWPQQFMVNNGKAPHECELTAVTAAAVAYCDELDGIADGVVAEPEACLERFDPFSVVGKTVPCADAPGGQIAVSEAAAGVANATWHGPRFSASGKQMWPGYQVGVDLTASGPRQLQPEIGVANTKCSNGTCIGVPWPIANVFLHTFLARDLTLNLANMTNTEFESLMRFGQHELKNFAATDPDLTDFQRAGGKMITYHGMADNILPTGGTRKYYQEVSAVSKDVHDFYRFFEVPGLAHCFGGQAGPPSQLFDQLRAWVENGTAPDSTPHEILNQVDGKIDRRLLCPFPQKPVFDKACADAGQEKCWSCPNVKRY